MGFFTQGAFRLAPECSSVAIPFRVGWGFSPRPKRGEKTEENSRNPFQGGMGFFTSTYWDRKLNDLKLSQSLSGWDGVFHTGTATLLLPRLLMSQSLSGWDGVFHLDGVRLLTVPFIWSQSLSGWDGVFHIYHDLDLVIRGNVVSQSLSGWDGVFHSNGRWCDSRQDNHVAIPFRVGWGFSLDEEVADVLSQYGESQSLSGWDGVFHNGDRFAIIAAPVSQSLSGWDGVFHSQNSRGGQKGGN